MVIIGLTGSIAMGKSTVASMFAALGAPVFDADAAVQALYAGEQAILIEKAFPGTLVNGRIDRDALSRRVLGNPDELKRLEAIVHPAVAAARQRSGERHMAEGRRAMVVDVPLLLETGAGTAVDLVVVVSAAPEVQRLRALRREGMTDAKLDAILELQMSDAEKRRRAHFVIDTGGSLEQTRSEVDSVMRATGAMSGRKTGVG